MGDGGWGRGGGAAPDDFSLRIVSAQLRGFWQKYQLRSIGLREHEGLARALAEGRATSLDEGQTEDLARGLARGLGEGLAAGLAKGLATDPAR